MRIPEEMIPPGDLAVFREDVAAAKAFLAACAEYSGTREVRVIVPFCADEEEMTLGTLRRITVLAARYLKEHDDSGE
jgi:hypothetical protein